MSENVYFAAFFFPSLAAVIIFSAKYVAEIVKSRGRLAQEDAYRLLAAQAVTAQTDTAATLGTVNSSLSDIQARLGTVEKILKDVG